MASSNTPGFKYLKFFKPDFHTEIASILKDEPMLKDVITLVLQNPEREREILTIHKVKVIRYNEIKVFNFENEADNKNGWLTTDKGTEANEKLSKSKKHSQMLVILRHTIWIHRLNPQAYNAEMRLGTLIFRLLAAVSELQKSKFFNAAI
ncbi:26652_t:CDS:2, partial [Dentiscutata erythropus]